MKIIYYENENQHDEKTPQPDEISDIEGTDNGNTFININSQELSTPSSSSTEEVDDCDDETSDDKDFERFPSSKKQSIKVIIEDSGSVDSSFDEEEHINLAAELWYKSRLDDYYNNREFIIEKINKKNFNKKSLSSDEDCDLSDDDLMSIDEIDEMNNLYNNIENEKKTKKELSKQQKEKLRIEKKNKKEERKNELTMIKINLFSKTKKNYYSTNKNNISLVKINVLNEIYNKMNMKIRTVKDEFINKNNNLISFIRESLLDLMLKINYDGVFNSAIVYNNKLINYLGFYYTLKLINKDFNKNVKFNTCSISILYRCISNEIKVSAAIFQSYTKQRDTTTSLLIKIKREIDDRKTSEYKANITFSLVFDYIRCYAFFTTNWPYFNKNTITRLSFNKTYKMLVIKRKCNNNKFKYIPLIKENGRSNEVKDDEEIISIGWKKDSNIFGHSYISNASIFLHIHFNLLMQRSNYERLLDNIGDRLTGKCTK